MKEIPIYGGLVALVDDEDYDLVKPYRWSADFRYPGKPYAIAQRGQLNMHRMIMGCTKGDGKIVDHVNPAETLNNTRANLRFTDFFGNSCNSVIGKNNTSGYKGVIPARTKGKWIARIKFHGRLMHLGTFSTKELAHQAYCEGSAKYHGEFGRTA